MGDEPTFRDAVEAAIRDGIKDWNGETNPERFAADAVLDMAELNAVADVLYRLAEGGRKMDHGRRQLEIWGVPESFIVWMLRETPKGTLGEPARTGCSEVAEMNKAPFTIDHLLASLQIEADFVVDRIVVTRGQRLVLRDLLQRAHDEIERLSDDNEALRADLAAAYCRMDDMEGRL